MEKLENQMEISQPGCSNDIIDTDESPVGRPSWSYALKDEINTRESCQVKKNWPTKNALQENSSGTDLARRLGSTNGIVCTIKLSLLLCGSLDFHQGPLYYYLH